MLIFIFKLSIISSHNMVLFFTIQKSMSEHIQGFKKLNYYGCLCNGVRNDSGILLCFGICFEEHILSSIQAMLSKTK